MTEKNYNPNQKEKKAMKKQEVVQTPKKQLKKVETQKKEKVEAKANELSNESPKEKSPEKPELKTETKEEKPEDSVKTESKEETPKKEEKPEEKKKEVAKVKKDKAVINGRSVPISTKYAIEICRFIKYKSIDIAINNLEQVLAHKKAVPMKGEYGHKKGKRMAGGRYPKKATEYFIKLLKNLSANAVANDLEEPIIVEAISNQASRPMGRFGRWQRKRTHIKIVVRKKKKLKLKEKKK